MWLGGLLALWEAASRLGWVNPLFMPAASDVLGRLAGGADRTLSLRWLQPVRLVLARLALSGLMEMGMA